MNLPRQYRLGDIFIMRFRGSGSAQHGVRPGVVFQNNTGNAHSPNIVALPLTTSMKKLGMPTHVLISASDSCLPKDSLVLCENPECVSKDDIMEYVGSLSDRHMKKIAIASFLASAAAAYMDFDDFDDTRRKSIVLNMVSHKECFSNV